MKPNYRSWELQLEDFYHQRTEEEKLQFLLRFAILAPSGHNTQPWNFSINGNEILVWVNRERSLEGSDPHRRQLLIAFGCMIENLSIAADYYDLAADVIYFPDTDNLNLVAKISIKTNIEQTGRHKHDLISAIPLRHTNRSKYKSDAISEDFLKDILSYQENELRIFSVTDQEKKNQIADIANNAQIEAMESPVFRGELSEYIRSNFTKAPTGMPGFVLGIPAPVSLFVPRLMKKSNLAKQNRKKDDILLKNHTPAFIVIASRNDAPKDWLNAGMLFEKIWLTATVQGLSCSPHAAPIQSPQYLESLKQVLETDYYPQVLFRFGYSDEKVRHSPRFAIDQLLI